MAKRISVLLLLVMVLSMCLTLVSCGVSGKTYKLDSIELTWDEDVNHTIKSGTMALVFATINAKLHKQILIFLFISQLFLKKVLKNIKKCVRI